MSESAPHLSFEKRSSERRCPRRWPAVVAAGALAFTGLRAEQAMAVTGQDTETRASIGFFSNYLFNKSPAAAETEAQAIEDAGGEVARIQVPYVNGSAEVNNMLPEICNAAEAAYSHHLKLQIVFQGYYQKTGKSGYLPTRANEKSRFKTMVVNLMGSLAGDKNPDGSGGCVPDMQELALSLVNEPTNPPMVRNQVVNGKEVAVEQSAKLYLDLYEPLHDAAEKLGLELTIIGGEIATTSRHHPLQTIEKLADALGGQKAVDAFGIHWYANGEDTTSNTPGANENSTTIQMVVDKVHEEFGGDMPVMLTELGAISDTPQSEESRYSVKLSPNTPTLKGKSQAEFYINAIKQAVCAGISEISIFHFTDDPADPLRTGLRFASESDKPGKNQVTEAIGKLKGGQVC